MWTLKASVVSRPQAVERGEHVLGVRERARDGLRAGERHRLGEPGVAAVAGPLRRVTTSPARSRSSPAARPAAAPRRTPGRSSSAAGRPCSRRAGRATSWRCPARRRRGAWTSWRALRRRRSGSRCRRCGRRQAPAPRPGAGSPRLLRDDRADPAHRPDEPFLPQGGERLRGRRHRHPEALGELAGGRHAVAGGQLAAADAGAEVGGDPGGCRFGHVSPSRSRVH